MNATNFEIYFNDPFLAFIYLASISIFVALYEAFKLLGYVRRNEVFSERAVKALRIIKYCGSVLIGFIVVAEGYIFLVHRGQSDDIAGGVAMGVMIIFVSAVITAASAMFERILQNAVDIKSENDLTV